MTSADYRRALALRELAAVTTGFPQYLLAPEIALILDAIPNLHRRLLFDTLWNTGARINEALALKPADISLNATRPFIILHTLKQRLRPQPGRPCKKEPVKRAVPLLDEAFTSRLRDGLATFTRHRTKPVWDVTDRCLFNRKLALNGRHCLLIDFSDDNFPLTVRFRTVGPQPPKRKID